MKPKRSNIRPKTRSEEKKEKIRSDLRLRRENLSNTDNQLQENDIVIHPDQNVVKIEEEVVVKQELETSELGESSQEISPEIKQETPEIVVKEFFDIPDDNEENLEGQPSPPQEFEKAPPTKNIVGYDLLGESFYKANVLISKKQARKIPKFVKVAKTANMCCFCEKSFTLPQILNSHILDHIGEKPYDCNLCTESFSKGKSLEDHKKQVHYKFGKEGPRCQECNMSFSTGWHLELHRRSTHTGGIKPFLCCHCNAKFKFEFTLRTHIKRHHPSKKVYKCQICGMQFSKNDYLRFHYLSHDKDRRVPCVHCKMRGLTMSVVKGESSKNTGGEGNGCKFCGKKYT